MSYKPFIIGIAINNKGQYVGALAFLFLVYASWCGWLVSKLSLDTHLPADTWVSFGTSTQEPGFTQLAYIEGLRKSELCNSWY